MKNKNNATSETVNAQLNKGWEIKKLGEVCEFYNGLWTGKKPPFQTVGVIRNTNFTKDCLLDDSDIVYLEVEQSQFKKRKLQFGDLILEKSGGGPKQPVGRVVVFDKEEGDFSFSNFTSTIRVKNAKELDFNFLHRYLFLQYISGATEKMQSHSTGIRNLKFDEYKEIEIPLPPLPEQQRIVSLLDKAFSAIERSRNNAEQNLKNAKELFESYLQGVFEKKGDDWDVKKLWEISDKIMTGPFGSMLHQSDYVKSGIPVVNPQNIVDEKIIPLQKTMINEETFNRLEKYALKLNDIVIARRGEMGRCAVVKKENVGWLCGTGSFVIRVNSKKVDSVFLNIILSSSDIKKKLEKSSIGATMPNLNQSILSDLDINLPPLETQQTIVRQLDALRAETQKLEAVYQKKIANLEELKKSILEKAFSGELETEKTMNV